MRFAQAPSLSFAPATLSNFQLATGGWRYPRIEVRFFGLLGTAAFGAGLVITLYLGVYRILGLGGISNRPLLVLGALLLVLGVQSVSLGLLGEIIIFTHARRVSEYRVAEIL